MRKIKIIFGAIALFVVAIYISGEWNMEGESNKICSENAMNLVGAIHVGMSATDVINIFRKNEVSYSIWKNEVEVEVNKSLPFPLEVVGTVKKKWTVLIGKKELIIVNFSERGNVSEHSCKVVLTGP